jgi:PhoH-like ATPase
MAIGCKTFVLDTNVILHDSSCIEHFDEHDVVIPITVIEELDQFKKGGAIINFHARQFLRALDNLCGSGIFNGGIPIGPGKGRVQVMLERPLDETLQANFGDSRPDHRILNTAWFLARQSPGRQVILVTKDVNLRMKAKAIGLPAADYTSDHVKNLTELYKGRRIVEGIAAELIDQLYADNQGVALDSVNCGSDLHPNEFLILRNGKKSALAYLDPVRGCIRRTDKLACYGIVPRNAEQAFALDALVNPAVPLVTVSGKAGTGKTLLALAAALETRRSYRQIFVARPIVPLSNKDIGFLPGDIQSKLDPYMQPLYDNLSVIQDAVGGQNTMSRRIREMLAEEKIVITALSYIRGRSLVKTYFIVDEAQNLTPHEVKTIITRAGEGTKVVFTGDVFQIDHPYLDSHSNGLSYLIEKMKAQPLAAHINLEKGERSELSELAAHLL